MAERARFEARAADGTPLAGGDHDDAPLRAIADDNQGYVVDTYSQTITYTTQNQE